MNGFPLNGAALNGGNSFASIVYLPAATATFEIALNERIAVSMAGVLDMGMTISGDISRVAILGSAPATISFAVSGTLTKNQLVSLGSGNLALGFAPTGTLSRVIKLPSGAITWGFALAGDVDRNTYLTGLASLSMEPTGTLASYRYLVASPIDIGMEVSGGMQLTGGLLYSLTGMSFDPTGSLSVGQRIALPDGTTGFELVPTGDLQGLLRFQGESQKAMELSGLLTKIQYMAGTASYQIVLTGDLANNAHGTDAGIYLMIRPYNEREMTR